jgi:hypothetical protein
MAGHGPAPSKDRSQRVRPGKDVPATTVVDSDDELRGPPLPEDALPEPWHPRTLAWWDTWRRSPQATTFIATDWDFLLDTALMHHTMWSKGRWEFASELRLRAAKFGATPEDRARLRMQVTATPTASSPADKPASRYDRLRAVKSA